MLRKLRSCLVVVGVAGSLGGCGKSVEAECTELVDSAYASMSAAAKEQVKDVRAMQIKSCIVSKK